MSVVAAIRPDSWNVPLLLHVAGAMLLVGGLFAGAGALALARGDARLLRLGYRLLLAVALPGWIAMRIGAAWIADKEGWDDLPEGSDDPAWLGIGYITAELGGLLLLIALIVGGIGLRRARGGQGGAGLLRVTLILSLVLLAAYVVAIVAMSGKPT